MGGIGGSGGDGGAGGVSTEPYADHWIGTEPGEEAILNDGLQLDAFIAFPADTGSFPAAILMHGCGGLYKNATDMGDDIVLLAQTLLDMGVAVLILDSFSARGYESVCNTQGELVHEVWDRVPDAYAALGWLQGQGFLRSPEDVVAVGLSHGGSAVMASVAREGLPPGMTPPNAIGFASAVAFYPGCGFYSEFFGSTSSGNYFPNSPLLMKHAGNDGLLAFCQARHQRAGEIAAQEGIENLFFLDPPLGYENADHGFMRCTAQKVVQGSCTEDDLSARDLALTDFQTFLANLFGL